MNNNAEAGNTGGAQGGQSLIGLISTEVVTAVESMSKEDANDRWGELPEVDRTRIWGELDRDGKDRLFKLLSDDFREPLWSASDAATKLYVFAGLPADEKSTFWGRISQESKETLWNSLTSQQKGGLLWHIPSDDVNATWRQWPDSIRHEVLDSVVEPVLAYLYRTLPAELRPTAEQFSDYLNRRWSAPSPKRWASMPLKSPEDLKIIWRGLSDASRNDLWGLLSPENKLTLFGALTKSEQKTLWQGLAASSREEFWNSLDFHPKVQLLEYLSTNDRNLFWQTRSPDEGDPLWRGANEKYRVWLLNALSQTNRNALWERRTADERRELWTALDEPGSGLLVKILSENHRNQLWSDLDANNKVKLFKHFSDNDRDTFWQALSLDERDTLWRDASMQMRGLLLSIVPRTSFDDLWARRNPDEDAELWAATYFLEKHIIAERLSPEHRLELLNKLDSAAKADIFENLSFSKCNSQWESCSTNQRNELWNDLVANDKVKVFSRLSQENRDKFWETYSVELQDALWRDADSKSRPKLLSLLSRKDNEALLTRRTADDRFEIWTSAGSWNRRLLAEVFSLTHRLELWNRLDANGQLELFEKLPQNARDELWKALLADQHNETTWNNLDANGKVKLFENLSVNDRNVFWQTLSPDDRDAVWGDAELKNRTGLLLALSQEDRKALWERRTPEKRLEYWTAATADDAWRAGKVVNALYPEHRRELWDRLDLNGKSELFNQLSDENRTFLWETISQDQRHELWNSLNANARVKLFDNLSIIDRNTFWRTLSIKQQDEVWRDADMSNRRLLVKTLSANDRDAMWERRTPEEHYILWAAAPTVSNSDLDDEDLAENDRAGLLETLSADQRNALWARIPAYEQEEHWHSCESTQKVDLFVSLSQSNRGGLWLLVSENFSQSGWRDFSANSQVRLLEALSESAREPLWESLGEERQVRLYRESTPDERNILRRFLSAERYDALVQAAAKPIRQVIESLLEHAEIAEGIGEERDALLTKLESIASDAKEAVKTRMVAVAAVLGETERDNFMSKVNDFEFDTKNAIDTLKEELIGALSGDEHNLIRQQKRDALAAAMRELTLNRGEVAEAAVDSLKQELIGTLPGDEQNPIRKQKSEALTAALLKYDRIVALQEARLKAEQIADFTFVCEREDAALGRQKDPTTQQIFNLPSPEKDKKQMPQILRGFAYNEATQLRMRLTAGQGTTGCVDMLIDAISKFYSIHQTEEAKTYKTTYKLLNAIFEKHGWDTIDKLTQVRTAGLPVAPGQTLPTESVEHADLIQIEVGQELAMSDTLTGMAHEGIGGTEEDKDRYRAIARLLQANNGEGNIDKANQEYAELVNAAKDQLNQRGKDGDGYVPPRLVVAIDFVSSDEVWGDKWNTHIEGEYQQKFETTSNPALKEVLRNPDERRKMLLDVQETLDEANEEAVRSGHAGHTQKTVKVPGIDHPVTSENIDELLLDAMRTYDREADTEHRTIRSTLTKESVAAYLQTKQALKTHSGATWQLLPVGNPDADHNMNWEKLTPAVQLQLEMVHARKPEVQEIVIGPEYGDADKARIWVATQLLDMTVEGIDNHHSLLKANHHKAVADGLTVRRSELREGDVEERDRLTARITEQEQLRRQKRRSELPEKIEWERKVVRDLVDQLNFPFMADRIPEDVRKQERLLLGPLRKELKAYSAELGQMQHQAQNAAVLDDGALLRIENRMRNQQSRDFTGDLSQRLEILAGVRERRLRKNVQVEHMAVQKMITELNSLQPAAEDVSLGEETSALSLDLITHAKKLSELRADLENPRSHLQLHDIETYLAIQREQRLFDQVQAQTHKIKLAAHMRWTMRQMFAMQSLGDAQELLAAQRKRLQAMATLHGRPEWQALDNELAREQADISGKQKQALSSPPNSRALLTIYQSLRDHELKQRNYNPEINRLAAQDLGQRRQRVELGLKQARDAVEDDLWDLNDLTLNKRVLHEQYESERGRWRANVAAIDQELGLVRSATPDNLTRMQGVIDEDRNERPRREQLLRSLFERRPRRAWVSTQVENMLIVVSMA